MCKRFQRSLMQDHLTITKEIERFLHYTSYSNWCSILIISRLIVARAAMNLCFIRCFSSVNIFHVLFT